MPTQRQSKWNWDPHLPLMDELYNKGLTICKISEAIQCDGFRPCQRAVYDKFKAMGYRTDHDRVLPPDNAGSPGDIEANGTPAHQQHLPMSMLENSVPRSAICVPIEDGTHTMGTRGSATQAISITSPKLNTGENKPYHPSLLSQGQIVNKDLTTHVASDAPRHLEKEHVNDSECGILSVPIVSVNRPHVSGRLHSDLSKTGQSQQLKRRNTSNTPEQEIIIQNLRKAGFLSDQQHSGGRTKPRRRKEAPDPATDFYKFLKMSNQRDSQAGQSGKDIISCSKRSRPMRKIRSMFDMKGSASKAQANQISLSADDDSGYQSGRGTPSTLQFRDSLTSRPESLTEFRGLYRVACCYSLHQPKRPDQHRETQPCHFCGCSSIHILAWSANRFTLQDFEVELQSMSLHDVQVLDAAGNSALHYAAISGAGYAHLKALIDAGVPLNVRNTASQNFLHCLRPGDTDTEICTVDCFKLGLIKLLELTEPQMDFGQQDNDGQTILHVLASHITEPELRDQTFKIFRNSSFSTNILNRFGESAKDLSPPDYEVGQTMFAADTFHTISTAPLDSESSGMSEWQQKDLKKMNSYNVIIEAHHNPHYVDSTTRESVLHALSRVSVQSRGIMKKNDKVYDLRQFVGKGVNLNRHNRDGHHPLTAFICNQEFRGIETGATMAKYIDILLWKDGRRCDRNNINVNMMSRNGATALYEAATQAQSDTVRSLVEFGANVNARLNNDPRGLSVLQATIAARNRAVQAEDHVLHDRFKNVISHLEHAGAIAHPNSLQERGRAT